MGVAGGKSLSAAYRASYDCNPTSGRIGDDASDLAALPHVKARIAELKKRVRAKVEKILVEQAVAPTPAEAKVEASLDAIAVNKAWIELQLVQIVQDGIARDPLYDKEGNPIGTFASNNLNAANRALELLGKERGMFVETKRDITDPLSAFTHQQLKELKEIFGEPVAGDSAAVRQPATGRPSKTAH